MLLCSLLDSLSCSETKISKDKKLGSLYLRSAALAALVCEAQKILISMWIKDYPAHNKTHKNSRVASFRNGGDALFQMS